MSTEINYWAINNAARALGQHPESARNNFISLLSDELRAHQKEIIAANAEDVKKAEAEGLPPAFIERLMLDKKGIDKIILGLKDISALKSRDGKILEEKKLKNGVHLKKVATSLGVVAVIYEARPEVTIDVAALCIKSGNAAILKGGSEAVQTNQALFSCIQKALAASKLPKDAIALISTSDRSVTDNLLAQHDYIDLVITRGGYDLVKYVQSRSTIPVLAHSAGGARIYVDKSADLSIVEKIVINAKTSKPAACNSLDTVILHQDIADKILPRLTAALEKLHVKVVNDRWDAEFLDLKIGIKIVKNLDAAIEFINTYTKSHSEGIIAEDRGVIKKFTDAVDAAAVFVNCSTRLHDGFVFEMGAEIGIATGKLHARGPVGLNELSTYKWEVYGNGQIKE